MAAQLADERSQMDRTHGRQKIQRSRGLVGPLAGLLVTLLAGCAATIDQPGVEDRTAKAIGRPTGSFTISGQTESTGGRIDYTVRTKDGASFTCYMYSATAFQRVMSFGQTPHSDAICTPAGGPAPKVLGR